MGMAQSIREQQHRALKLQITDPQRRSGRQHLDQELRAARGLGRDEEATIANRSHFALDPVQGSECFR